MPKLPFSLFVIGFCLFSGSSPLFAQIANVSVNKSSACPGESFTITYSGECSNTCCDWTDSYQVNGSRIEVTATRGPQGVCNFAVTPFSENITISASSISPGSYTIYMNGNNTFETITIGGEPSYSFTSRECNGSNTAYVIKFSTNAANVSSNRGFR